MTFFATACEFCCMSYGDRFSPLVLYLVATYMEADLSLGP